MPISRTPRRCGNPRSGSPANPHLPGDVVGTLHRNMSVVGTPRRLRFVAQLRRLGRSREERGAHTKRKWFRLITDDYELKSPGTFRAVVKPVNRAVKWLPHVKLYATVQVVFRRQLPSWIYDVEAKKLRLQSASVLNIDEFEVDSNEASRNAYVARLRWAEIQNRQTVTINVNSTRRRLQRFRHSSRGTTTFNKHLKSYRRGWKLNPPRARLPGYYALNQRSEQVT